MALGSLNRAVNSYHEIIITNNVKGYNHAIC